ncbi:MAG: TonB-dependent receptor [Bacteroidales bacterium]|nr:TonB-dependent receptor [Bacteroidales bacterium]
MNKDMKITTILLGLLLMFNFSMAQRPGHRGSGVRPTGTIEGQVFDDQTGNPLQFANIAAYRHKDSTLVTGAIADSTGKFKLKQVPFGLYYLEANFIGYKKQVIDEIKVFPRNRNVTIDKIYLKPSAQNLEGVDISAERNRIEYQIDKKVVNVSKDLNASGGTAVDVLENVPSIEVDIDDNVTLRGSSSFKVYIDGKPTVLEGNDLLKQIPASNIKQIEIITNPSAKYDPDGVGGIINIVMKKEQKGGLNGVVNASVSNNNSYSGDFLLNYKTGKFNIFAGADYRNHEHGGQSTSERETYFHPDSTFYYFSKGDRSRNRDGYSFQGGFDYHLNDNHTLSLSGRGGRYGFGFDSETRIHSYVNDLLEEKHAYNENVFERSGDYYRITGNYQWKIDDKGQELMAMAYYSSGDDEEEENQVEFTAGPEYEIMKGINPDKIRSTEEENSNQIRFKVDYTLPLKNQGRFEAGVQSRTRQEDADYDFTFYDHVADEWITNPDFSSTYDFDREIYSAYTTFANSWGLLSYQLGFRGEYTDRQITKTTGESYVIDRWDWFPTVHLSTELDDKHKLQASYSRRINRPRGWFLDPVMSYMDKYSLRQGNPGLEPEYSNSYELSFMRRIKSGFINLEGYYRKTLNEITRLQSPYDQQTMLMTFENLNSEESLGLELMLNSDITKWWKLNLSGTFYHFQVNDEIEGQDISRESDNWRTRMNSTFDLTKSTRLQASIYYNAPSVTIQGERSGFFFTSMAVRQDMLQNKLSLTLRMRDLFNTMEHEFIADQPTYYTYNKRDREWPVVRFSVSYKINDYKRERDRMPDEDPSEGMEEGF